MFDFQKLRVYQKTKLFRKDVHKLIKDHKFGGIFNDQFLRASISIPLNIAEGSSRYCNKEKRRYYEIARGSAFECVSIIEMLYDDNLITEKMQSDLYDELEAISKMLYSMMKELENRKSKTSS